MDRKTYLDTLGSELRELSFRIDTLRRRMPTESGQERVHDAGELVVLEHRRQALADRIAQARTMKDDFWSRLKAELEVDWAELRDAVYRFHVPQR
jgi:uncharacterized protein involved in exopolysaccharide biosynthesis